MTLEGGRPLGLIAGRGHSASLYKIPANVQVQNSYKTRDILVYLLECEGSRVSTRHLFSFCFHLVVLVLHSTTADPRLGL